MKTISKRDINKMVKIQQQIEDLREKFEEDDYKLVKDCGEYQTAANQLSVASAALEDILQDFYE